MGLIRDFVHCDREREREQRKGRVYRKRRFGCAGFWKKRDQPLKKREERDLRERAREIGKGFSF